MPSQSLWQCEFLIPMRRDSESSDGQLHPSDAWEWLDMQLWDEFGGATIAPGLYDGRWRSPAGVAIADQSRMYMVAMPRKQVARLCKILRRACVVFHQQCLYLNVAGKVEFVRA